MQKKYLLLLLIGIGLVGLTSLVYSPGLGGMFLFDDKPNIVDNKGLILEDYSIRSFVNASLSGVSTLKRPVSMASFVLNIELCGLTPFCFKVVNLAIHIVCGLLVFALVILLLRRYREIHQQSLDDNAILLAAFGVALLWLLHPINLTGVLYVVQRMTSLSACFSLAGMILYMVGRNRLLQNNSGHGYVISGFLMTIPAIFSKENGILLPFFLFLIEVFFFQFKCRNYTSRQLLIIAFSICVVVPVLFISVYLIANPEWLSQSYAHREFNLYERLLSEARIFWLYVSLIYLPSNQRLSLFHDYIDISRGLLDPITTLLSLIALTILVTGALYTWRRLPLLSFGIFFFIGGHLVESTFLPLELVFEHRNYLPSIGLLLPLCYYLVDVSISVSTVKIRRTALISLLILFGIVTSLRASQWGNPLLLAELEVANNTNSARVYNLAGNVYASLLKRVPEEEREQYYRRALDLFGKSSTIDPLGTSGLASTHILKAREKDEHDPDAFSSILKRIREKKITATDASSIKHLIECVGKSTCKSSVINIEDMAEALDANQHDSGEYKAVAYSAVGMYFWNENIDRKKGLHYIEKAYRNYKGSRMLNLNYAKALTAMGYYDKARSILQEIKKDDFFDIRQDEIRQLEIVINANDYQAG